MQNEPLEILKELVGCDYISDLRFEPYKSIAKKKLKYCRFEGCALKELNDLTHYLFGISSFTSKDEAVAFLISQ